MLSDRWNEKPEATMDELLADILEERQDQLEPEVETTQLQLPARAVAVGDSTNVSPMGFPGIYSRNASPAGESLVELDSSAQIHITTEITASATSDETDSSAHTNSRERFPDDDGNTRARPKSDTSYDEIPTRISGISGMRLKTITVTDPDQVTDTVLERADSRPPQRRTETVDTTMSCIVIKAHGSLYESRDMKSVCSTQPTPFLDKTVGDKSVAISELQTAAIPAANILRCMTVLAQRVSCLVDKR